MPRIGTPPFPARQLANGRLLAKLEHVWLSVRRYAHQQGYEYNSSYGVIGIAPT